MSRNAGIKVEEQFHMEHRHLPPNRPNKLHLDNLHLDSLHLDNLFLDRVYLESQHSNPSIKNLHDYHISFKNIFS